MKIVDAMTARFIGGSLILALLASSCAVALPGPQEASPNPERQEPAAGQAAPSPDAAQPAPEALPDSPGAGQLQAPEKAAEKSQSPQPQPGGHQKPVGTAAAETSSTTGFAVSKPAGEALAPAKQKRTRTILISVAALVGAAVAIGTVAALSKGTPSKPPGSQ